MDGITLGADIPQIHTCQCKWVRTHAHSSPFAFFAYDRPPHCFLYDITTIQHFAVQSTVLKPTNYGVCSRDLCFLFLPASDSIVL